MSTDKQLNTSAVSCRVGCSGWQYRHWRGDFYPAGLPQARWLEHYAARFDTVEINNTFYRLPEASTFSAWRSRVPNYFLYAVKASRFLTHMKKLKEPNEPLKLLFSRLRRLGPALGPVLYQLPPRWPVNPERFEVFLRALPRGYRHVVEFREPSWHSPEVFALLDRYGAALCLHDMAGSGTGQLSVGPFVYARFHGTAKYSGSYDDAALRRWAGWMKEQMRGGKDVFAYFNNDAEGHATRNARRLRELCN
jgi:uncharacterized protein YecE (DUF72 family)